MSILHEESFAADDSRFFKIYQYLFFNMHGKPKYHWKPETLKTRKNQVNAALPKT